MSTSTFAKGIAAATLSLLAASASAHAASLVGLSADGTRLVMIDGAAKKVTGTVALAGGAKLVGIDVRPADGRLYGLTASGDIVTINPQSGQWEKKATLSEKLPAGATFTVDFNPVADRLRVIGSDGTSLRINVDDGKTIVDGRLRYADADAAKGKAPMVTAGAYVNSFAGTKETTLYDIDTTAGTLLRQAPPNDGILNTIGSLGIKLSGPVAFDIASDGKGGNTAWLISGGTIYTVDMATGAAKASGTIAGLSGGLMDMAVLR